MSVLEAMCIYYWDAAADGYRKSGGKHEYPTWEQAAPGMKREMMRCMRHAACELGRHIEAGLHEEMFPEPVLDRPESLSAENAEAFIMQNRIAAIGERLSP